MTTRRDFVRASAIGAAASVAGMTVPTAGTAVVPAAEAGTGDLRWSKAPCRFCGTGCGVSVAVQGNRVVATVGDPEAEVNRGLTA